MAKILKKMVFKQKKNPPAPPRPDYEGDKMASHSENPFYDHNYENITQFKCKEGSEVRFMVKKESEPHLVVFDNYSEPADLRAEISALEAEDPLYMSPLDDRGTAPPLEDDGKEEDGTHQLEDEEDMYCVPYDTPEDEETADGGPPPLPQPCLAPGRLTVDNPFPEDATYDVVPDKEDEDEQQGQDSLVHTIEDEYDEPWEWSVGARLTSSLQVSPAPSLEEDRLVASDLEEEDSEAAMTARQQRRLLYETAFDSRVKRDADDLDRLMQQNPLFLNSAPANETVARAASRSSFGSTSGSSASSTPTHQPMEIARQSPRHFTPTERRKVTLIRDCLPRSISPQTRPSGLKSIVNQNFERKISFISNNQWDNVSRCSSSDKSSSQESMNIEMPSRNEVSSCLLGRSASRDSLNVFRDDRRNLTSNYPNNWKELTNSKLENTNDLSQSKSGEDAELLKDNKDQASFVPKKSIGGHPMVKVLPNNSPRFSKTKSSKSFDLTSQTSQDPELKENNSQTTESHLRRLSRPSSLLSEVRPMDNLPQSPENDNRSSEDYDPPWDLKIINSNIGMRPSGVNTSVSVPEKLFSSGQPKLPTSKTHLKLDSEEVGKDGPTTDTKPNGLSSRPHLNLNLNADSPRKARQNLTLNFGCTALSAVGEKVDSQLTLEKQGWYHGSISRVDAEGKLRVLKEGSYLVRNSESSKQDYSLSLKSARGFMHMKIVPTSEGRFILGQFSNPFSSIPEMIQHYSVNKLPIKGAEHMSLLYPVIDQLL